MGQYHKVVNLDKYEYIDPHQLGCGLKLWEQLANPHGTGSGLLALLACSNGRGGGDFGEDKAVVGRWAGDRIAVVGDYAEDNDLPATDGATTIYDRCGATNIDEALEGYTQSYRMEHEADFKDKPMFADITPLVAALIERELDGKFTGDGWKDWEPNDAEQPPPTMKPDIVLTIR